MKSGRIILLLTFSIVAFSGRGQHLSEPPPEPYATAQEVPGSECAGEGTGGGTPPPPGLCLPINDYLLPLLVSGAFLGSFYILKIQKKKEFTSPISSVV